jgi:hypothetical protein
MSRAMFDENMIPVIYFQPMGTISIFIFRNDFTRTVIIKNSEKFLHILEDFPE